MVSVLRCDCRFRYPSGFSLNLAFEASAGITALVGPSGSGKTTTLRLIAGLLRPFSGKIELGSRMLTHVEQQIQLPPEKRAIGLVFQDYQLFPHLTVEQNLRYGLERRQPNGIDLHHLVEMMELDAYLRRYPRSLSGGQQQRVALARAILSSPELLLLDEPLSALDEALQSQVAEFILRIIGEYHIPTLLVTHDSRSVERLAGQVLRMEQIMAIQQPQSPRS